MKTMTPKNDDDEMMKKNGQPCKEGVRTADHDDDREDDAHQDNDNQE